MIYNFEWDPNKARLNKQKHKVSFEEAATVFHDPTALTIYDPDHSENEDRWITIGISKSGKLLVTCHTYQEENNKTVNVRIFSGRKAKKAESKQYGE
ncbi:MAG: BrnT family toxin [Thermodesulfobacteriota bacterium]|nr:BrnT family toxin [Thermodesulfobacteriota bacterium]